MLLLMNTAGPLWDTDAKLFARFKQASPTSPVWKECVKETGRMMMLAKVIAANPCLALTQRMN